MLLTWRWRRAALRLLNITTRGGSGTSRGSREVVDIRQRLLRWKRAGSAAVLSRDADIDHVAIAHLQQFRGVVRFDLPSV